MRHFVFLRFAGENYNATLKESMVSAMEKAQAVLQGFLDFQMYENRTRADGDTSVLIELSFIDAAAKDTYLKHPLHLALLEKIKPIAQEKAAFDSI